METTCTAWNVTRYGGPDVLSPIDRALPTPQPGQILVRIRASGVTRADCMMRSGTPKFARAFLGWKRPRADGAGTCFSGDVIALGEGVTQFGVGDAILGEAGLQFGANATHICLDADGSLVRKPDGLRYEEAAVMCDGPMTSWHFLTHLVQIRPGDRVLILGGSGSLGTAAIQFAVALGAAVTATSSARNKQLLHSLGATQAIDYRSEDPFGTDEPYDVIFDTLGIASCRTAKKALTKAGRYICPVLTLALLRDVMLSRLLGRKRALFAAAGMEKTATHRKQLGEILGLAGDGRFCVVMDRTYPLSDLIEAHRYVETGRKRGNVIVV